MGPMQLSLVHPCFNEEQNIERTVRLSLAWLSAGNFDAEVIVVNDGSKDGSAAILDRLTKEDVRVKVVTHPVNQGYGRAVRSGCDAALKDVIAFMDSDGQFKVEDLALLIPHLNENDIVVGRRRRRADPFIRNAFGKFLGLLIFLTFGAWIRDVNCGLKVFKKSLWSTIRPLYGTEKFFNTEIFLRLKKNGIQWKQIAVPHYPRTAGNPTGGSVRVIFGMFRELFDLKRKLNDGA